MNAASQFPSELLLLQESLIQDAEGVMQINDH